MATYTVKSRIDGNTIYVETFDAAGKIILNATRKFASYAKTADDQKKEMNDAEKSIRDVIDATGEPPKKSSFQKQAEAENAMLGDSNPTTYTYEYEVISLDDGSTKNFYLYEIGHNLNKGHWENELYSETPMAETSPEAAKERAITEILKNGEDSISGSIEDLEKAGDRNKKVEPTPAKLAESAATKNDPALTNKEPYVTSGDGSKETDVNQVKESLKEKTEPPTVTVNVNVPESKGGKETLIEKSTSTTDLTKEKNTELTPGSTVTSQADKVEPVITSKPENTTPSTTIVDPGKQEKKEAVKEATVVQNNPKVPVDQSKEENKTNKQTTLPGEVLTVELALAKYYAEHGLNPDGSAKDDKANVGNSSPAASSLAVIHESLVPKEKSISAIESVGSNFKPISYQQVDENGKVIKKEKEVPTDQSKALKPEATTVNKNATTTPSSATKIVADEKEKPEQKYDYTELKATLLKLQMLEEVGYFGDKATPTTPGQTGTAVEEKEKAKEQKAEDKTQVINKVSSAPVTNILSKSPTVDKKAMADSEPHDPSKDKKDLLAKIIDEGKAERSQIGATVKTTPTGDHNVIANKGSDQESIGVKVKTAEKQLTPEIAKGIMQNSPETKAMTTVNETLAKVQSTLSTIGQTQITNANNSNTVNNHTSTVNNEDNRKLSQAEQREEKKTEKEKAEQPKQNSNELTEFYLHEIYDALVSQGIKIKSY